MISQQNNIIGVVAVRQALPISKRPGHTSSPSPPNHFHQLRLLSTVMEIRCYTKGCIGGLAEELIHLAKIYSRLLRSNPLQGFCCHLSDSLFFVIPRNVCQRIDCSDISKFAKLLGSIRSHPSIVIIESLN